MATGGCSRALPLCIALMLWSADASAVVLPPCSQLFVRAAPLPIEAGQVAVYLQPNTDGGAFTLEWRDAEGQAVPFERFEPDGRVFLRPMVPISGGIHALVYADACTAEDGIPSELELRFAAAPPPPATLGEISVQYAPYCPGDPVPNPATDFPGLVHVLVSMRPELEPYLPFMHGTLSDDTGTLHNELWHAPNGFSASIHAACGGWSPALPPGLRTITLEAEIIDRVRYDALVATADIECAECQPFMGRSTGGMAEPMPAVDAGPPPSFRGGDEADCSIAGVRRGRAGLEIALLGVVVALIRRVRRRCGILLDPDEL